MSYAYLFEGMKVHYRARGLSCRDVAKTLKISEATVKHIFSARECTLACPEQLCSLAPVDIARGAPRPTRLITQLTEAQEQELVDDLRLLIVAVCAMGNVPLEDIMRVYAISKAQCVGLLARLEQLALEYADQHSADAWLPLEQRESISLCLAPCGHRNRQHLPSCGGRHLKSERGAMFFRSSWPSPQAPLLPKWIAAPRLCGIDPLDDPALANRSDWQVDHGSVPSACSPIYEARSSRSTRVSSALN